MDYNGKSYADLPMEIVLRIFGYLNASDMLEAGLTCRQWFDALCHKKFMSRIQIQFEKLQLSDIRSPPLNVFKESMRLYSNIRLNQVDLDGNSLCFWQRFGACLNHVEFNACDMHERTFSAILLAMNNLESIAILNCRDLFLTGHLFKNPEDQVAIRATCKNLKSLSLSNNRYISDAIFHRMGEMQSIANLNLSGCLISFHTGLYRKFYPNILSQQEPSENVFTFFVIMQFIEKHAKTLKFLDFSETLIDSNAMNRLAEVEHLQLHGLKLRSCDQLTNNAISRIVNSHKTITEIDLSLSVRFTDVSLLNALSNLKVLKMRRCRAITDQNIHQIHQLKHLEHLDLSQCDGITSKGFIEGIASQTNDTMVELYLSALNICELAVIKLAETMKNLRLLDLSFCKNAVTNLAVQIIFKHLKMLRTLNLEFCDMVSDAGITGLGMESKIEQYEQSILSRENDDGKPDISNTETKSQINVCFDEPNRNAHRISLRSKAEEEIVNESKRKMFLLNMCEQLANNGESNCSRYSIGNLKGLRSLNLASCNQITDVSLKYAFDFLELETLNMSKCQQITAMGIAGLKCPSIKVLNISDCHNLSDQAIHVISTSLKRLTYLHIERCSQLTDISLDAISKHCKHLKYLDVRGCRLMCGEPRLKLLAVHSLQQILVSKPGPYI